MLPTATWWRNCGIPDQGLEPREAIDLYRKELLEQQNSDFIPYTFQVPVSVVDCQSERRFAAARPGGAGRAGISSARDYRAFLAWLGSVSATDAGSRSTAARSTCRSWNWPRFATASACRGWFDVQAKGYQQRRNRYNTEAHLDLHDLLTNFGATRFNGGLNLAANLLGKPGKMDVQGYMVQDLYNDGQLAEINDYCRCDVLDTYFVFLRTCACWSAN